MPQLRHAHLEIARETKRRYDALYAEARRVVERGEAAVGVAALTVQDAVHKTLDFVVKLGFVVQL